jgi:flagellum-specific peptidoglycan hydrolase FlgJ
MITFLAQTLKMHTRFVATIAAIALTALSTSASATVTDSTVTIVEYTQGTLLVQVATGANFYAQLSAPAPCVSVTIDTIKAWQSLAQAALLSGKGVRIFSQAGTCTTSISTIDLNK